MTPLSEEVTAAYTVWRDKKGRTRAIVTPSRAIATPSLSSVTASLSSSPSIVQVFLSRSLSRAHALVVSLVALSRSLSHSLAHAHTHADAYTASPTTRTMNRLGLAVWHCTYCLSAPHSFACLLPFCTSFLCLPLAFLHLIPLHASCTFPLGLLLAIE